ncbi:MAG: dockerin type I repeat-containing protein [Oscillospiraceae bacterium]|nr:dockerin type I repeat-containing protein [Oscillospiraceae bacterium]
MELVSYQPYYGGSTFFVLTEKNEIFELNMSYSYYTPETGYVDISFSVTIRPGDEKYRYLFKTKAETKTPVSEKEKYQTADIVSVMQYIFGMENVSKESWMDLDGNGTINVIDLVIIKKEILKNF